MGRIDSADVFQDDKAIYPSGYILSVQTDGAWELVSAAYKKPVAQLASGTASLMPGEWHRFALTFHGDQISATLDGSPLANIKDGIAHSWQCSLSERDGTGLNSTTSP